MYCKHCGRPLADGVRFCLICGGAVETGTGQPADFPESWAHSADSAPVRKKRGKLGVILSLTGAAAAAIAVFILLSPLTGFNNKDPFKQTVAVLENELSLINSELGIPSFSETDPYRVSLEINGFTVASKKTTYTDDIYENIVDMTALNILLDLIVDNDSRRASLDIQTGSGAEKALLTLFADMNKLAVGFNDGSGWSVGAKSFGRELAEWMPGMDPDFELDMSVLFPDDSMINDQYAAAYSAVLEKFITGLRFEKDSEADTPDFLTGSFRAETAGISEEAVQDLLLDLLELYFDQLDDIVIMGSMGDVPFDKTMRSDMRREIRQIRFDQAGITIFISDENIIQAVKLDVRADRDNSVSVVAGMCGETYLIDHLFLKITVKSDGEKETVTIESKGRHVPVDGVFTDVTTIKGPFETIRLTTTLSNGGESRFSITGEDFSLDITGRIRANEDSVSFTLTSFEMNQSGYYKSNNRLDGNITMTIERVSPEDVREIAKNAGSGPDHLKPLLKAVEKALHKDDFLIEAFGDPFYELVCDLLFPEYSDMYRDYGWDHWWDMSGFRLPW